MPDRLALDETAPARHYHGPEAEAVAPWSCPACGVLNAGRLVLGCSACGAGAPGRHVDQPPPARRLDPPALLPHREARGVVYAMADAWAARNTQATSVEAFVAGYLTAVAEGQALPRAAVEQLAP